MKLRLSEDYEIVRTPLGPYEWAADVFNTATGITFLTIWAVNRADLAQALFDRYGQ